MNANIKESKFKNKPKGWISQIQNKLQVCVSQMLNSRKSKYTQRFHSQNLK